MDDKDLAVTAKTIRAALYARVHPRSDASVHPIFAAISLIARPEFRTHWESIVEPFVGPIGQTAAYTSRAA